MSLASSTSVSLSDYLHIISATYFGIRAVINILRLINDAQEH